MRIRRRKVTVGVVFAMAAAALVLAGHSAAWAQMLERSPAPGRSAAQVVEFPDRVPIEVRDVVATPAGVAATLVNLSRQRIIAFDAALVGTDDSGQDQGLSMTTSEGLDWAPGATLVVTLAHRGPLDGIRVEARAAMLGDGSGAGDPDIVARFRRHWGQRGAGLAGALDVLAAAPMPATESDLQALIDQVAMAMARAPVPRGPAADLTLQPYMRTVTLLKALQGREMVGTPTFEREMDRLRDTLKRELDALSSSPR